MKIDDAISKIKPYLLSIRYKEDIAMVDVKLKEGWGVPNSEMIGVSEYEKYPNTYIFYSKDKEVGVDEIVDFISEIIKINIEKEKKLALLNQRKNDLTKFFLNHSLEELEHLTFEINRGVRDVDLLDENVDVINVEPQEFNGDDGQEEDNEEQ